jgi:glutamate carboxypeptidase
MQNLYQPLMEAIANKQETMTALLEEWSNINSCSDNLSGLSTMLQALKKEFSTLKAGMKDISLPPRKTIDSSGEITCIPLGKALYLCKRPQAPIKVFLGGHMDTVYPLSSPFQKAIRISNHTLNGPGVADMKGGLVILLNALQAFEASPLSGNVGWEVLINPDEELGSPGSSDLFAQIARRNDLGLIFEPSFHDGTFVSSRKGSATFAVVARGIAAHSGRDFFKGRNAISALARFISKAETLIDREKEVLVNVGSIRGGSAANVVPDLAICKINVRTSTEDAMQRTKFALETFIEESSAPEGIQLSLHQEAATPPKPYDEKLKTVFGAVEKCCKILMIDFNYKPSGGACDGSRLYAYGLPNIDTMGAVGGHIHTPEEYIVLPSLVERAKLTALFLMMLASHELTPFNKERSYV